MILGSLIFSIIAAAAAVGITHLIERINPARSSDPKTGWHNFLYLSPYELAQVALAPLAGGIVAVAVNAIGGGIITLPDAGLGLLAGICAYTFAMDFAEFVFHYAQHKIPVLWALHSLHHSDRGMNATTTFRHFWPDSSLKAVTVYPCVGLLLHTNAAIITTYMLISYYNFFPHGNIRCGFGRLSWLLNSPQYHRLHHSRRIDDRDMRFAALFPIFDVMFGLYAQPKRDEYPETGLDDDDSPENLLSL